MRRTRLIRNGVFMDILRKEIKEKMETRVALRF